MSTAVKELAREWFESVWNKRSTEAIYRLADPQCLGHLEGEEITGPEAVQAMRDGLCQQLPDLQVTVEDIVAGEHDAVVRWRLVGTARNGRPCAFTGMSWLKFRQGLIVEGWDCWNQGALIQHLQLSA